MKLTILGSGTCASQLPGIPNRYPPGFLVEWVDQRILFDCSEGMRFRLQDAGYDYAAIQHLAISHAHPDHFALPHFIQSVYCHGAWGGRKNETLNIYCPGQIVEDFPALWQIHFPERGGKYFDYPKLNFVPAAETASQIGNGILTAKKVQHGNGLVDALAFRLETPEGIFVYSGDSGDCQGLRQIIKGADIFVCDATAKIEDKNAPLKYGHLNPFVAAEMSKSAGVKKLILTHYTGLDSDEAMIAEAQRAGYEGEIVIAKDFQTHTI